MDVNILAKDVVSFLLPMLPYLVEAGEEAAKEAGKKFGAATWEKEQAIWAKLSPKTATKPTAQKAIQDVMKTPDDADAQATLRQQVKKLLNEDTELAEELEKLWQVGPQTPPAIHIDMYAGDNAIPTAPARDVKIRR